jgi:hypothetical protein
MPVASKYKDAVFFDWEALYPAIRVIAIDFVYQGFGGQGRRRKAAPFLHGQRL